MTSDQANDGSQGDRPSPRNRSSRPDQGDLWADAAETPDTAPSASTPPAPTAPVPEHTEAPAPAQDAAWEPEEDTTEPEIVSQPARPARRETTRPRAAAPVVAPPPPPQDEYANFDDYDDTYYEDEPSVLSNPFVLAAIAVAAAVVLAVIVVFFFGRGSDTQLPGTNANVTPSATSTAPAGSSPSPLGVMARSIAVATVREGPALSFLELGTLQTGQNVEIVGRNEESSWFQIVFPADSALRGWVPNSALRLPSNVDDVVAVVGATPMPRPDPPTPTTAPDDDDETPTPTPEGGGADIAVVISSNCTPGTEIVLSIANVGTVALEDDLIEVVISNNGVVVFQQSFEAEIAVGASASLNTGVPAAAPQMAVSVLLSALDDVDSSNNTAGCTVQGGGGNVPPAIQTQLAQ